MKMVSLWTTPHLTDASTLSLSWFNGLASGWTSGSTPSIGVLKQSRHDWIESKLAWAHWSSRLSPINRALDSSGQTVTQILATQVAQQKAIDALAARVTRLEQERRQQQ
jgi:hypothetical protein